MQIRFAVTTGRTIPLSKILPFQNDMKFLSVENYLKLRREIEETGFSFAVHVWENADKFYCLDGHQRVECLRKMMAEYIGEFDPEVPVVIVEAKDFKEAKRKCLSGASQYGTFSLEKTVKTIAESGITLDQAKGSFNFPKLDASIFESKKKVEFSAGEKGPKHECPSCHHRF